MASPPASTAFPSRRTAQAALGAFVLCVLALVAWRVYFPRLQARPTDDAPPAAVSKPLDLNAADRTELLQLPGVGPNMADAILTHRQTVGRFESVDDLSEVKGVGDKTLAKLRPLLSVEDGGVERLERKRPDPLPVVAVSGKKVQDGEKVNVNTASEAELQKLPRVGPVLAAAIVSARNQKPFVSVDDLRRAKGVGVKTLDSLRPFVTID